MKFSLFSRGQRSGTAAKPASRSAVQVLSTGPCSAPGCGHPHGWQCCYADARGAGCRTWWCPDHATMVEQSPFCPRHARVARLLVSRVGSLHELPLPAVDDRALPALLELTDRLDQRVVRVLAHLYRGRVDVTTSPHANVRERRSSGRHECWEASWAATSVSGYLTTIALRATSEDGAVVHVYRDGNLVAEGPIGFEPGLDPATADLLAQRIYELLVATFAASPLPATG